MHLSSEMQIRDHAAALAVGVKCHSGFHWLREFAESIAKIRFAFSFLFEFLSSTVDLYMCHFRIT